MSIIKDYLLIFDITFTFVQLNPIISISFINNCTEFSVLLSFFFYSSEYSLVLLWNKNVIFQYKNDAE